MADARRLIELGMVPELAKEIVRQIDGTMGTGSQASTLSDHEARIAAIEEEMGDTIGTDQTT